jgi:spheroidene monooxygenase
MSEQIATISFFRYRGIKNKLWGMSQMYKARAPMRKMHGIEFFKPLGTGSGAGYSVIPDFHVYGMLAVWHSKADAEAYVMSGLYEAFKAHSVEHYTIFMHPISSKGSWSGYSNWKPNAEANQSGLISAITRATLKKHFLYKFWRMVPRVSFEHKDAEGLLFSKGIGEIPLLEQATFTVWKDKKDMERFAYQSFHSEAISITRLKKGFSEEMFTRLKPYRAIGSWNNKNPIQEYLAVSD